MNHDEIDLELNDFNNQNIGRNIHIEDNYNNDQNNNNINDHARNFEDNLHNIDHLTLLKEKNKKINIDKIGFFKFLIYSTKAEIHINSFKDLLYWISLLEIFLYILSILLFISSPSNFYIFWTFTTHCVRGVVGLIVLFRIPDSYLAVENIENFDSTSIETLQEQMATNYFNILQENESRIKPLLIVYFTFSVINIIVDIVIFFYLLSKWNDQEYSLANIIALLIIVVFYGKIFFEIKS